MKGLDLQAMNNIQITATCPSGSVRDIQTADGAVLLDKEQGLCFSMNIVGTKIWNLLKLRQPVDSITRSVAQEFGMDESQVRQDVMEFVRALKESGLLLCQNETRRGWVARLLGL